MTLTLVANPGMEEACKLDTVVGLLEWVGVDSLLGFSIAEKGYRGLISLGGGGSCLIGPAWLRGTCICIVTRLTTAIAGRPAAAWFDGDAAGVRIAPCFPTRPVVSEEGEVRRFWARRSIRRYSDFRNDHLNSEPLGETAEGDPTVGNFLIEARPLVKEEDRVVLLYRVF
ncbi:hypothetical protein FOZ62_002317 [Perkinsus olseni]|uniref:Uncharacterized protein n=1 Tax=Perkinsus olseni TaxID=32597 RepID=A0A7J6RWP7_PEROL|nr:hypothetical protein FOZ62_002317 [Perkinsus olseni]